MKKMKWSKVDQSPNKEVYIALRKNGASYNVLTDESKKLGEHLSTMTFQRYFTKHNNLKINQILQERIDTIGSDRKMSKSRKESVIVIDEIQRNLNTLNGLISYIIQQKPNNAQEINACTGLLKEARMTLQYLDRKKKDLLQDKDLTPDSSVTILMDFLKDIPMACPKCNEPLDILDKLEKKIAVIE